MSAGKRDGGSLPDALPLAPEFGEAENAPHLALHGDLPADVGSPPAETPDLSVNLLQPGTPSPGAPKAEIPEAANRAPEQAGGDPAPLADGEHFALIDRDQMFPSDAGICVPAEIREPYTFTDAAMESLQVGDRLPGDLGTVSGMEYWTSEDGEEELFLGVLAPEGYEYWYGTARKDGTWRLVGDDDFMLEYPAGSKLLLITPQCEIFDGQNYIDENTALGYLGGGYPTHRVDSIYDLFTVRYEVGGGGYAYDEVSECEICFTVEAGRVTKIYRFYRP